MMSQIYYYVLEGSRYLLADERNKKHLLDAILALHRQKDWPVYAFCITDDNAYVITDGDDSQKLEYALRQQAGCFIRNYEELAGDFQRTLRVSPAEKIQDDAELMRRCRAVHRLPLVLGYSRRAADYWWSSYRNYVRGEGWESVRCGPLLHCFAADPEEALRKFKTYHTGKG